MSDVKICKECKFCKVSWIDRIVFFGNEYAKCTKSIRTVESFEYVNGKKVKTVASNFCCTERNFSHLCGPEGKYWEKK